MKSKRKIIPWNKGKKCPYLVGDKNPAKRPSIRKILKEQKLGDKNPSWNSKPSYHTIHNWVYYHFDKPSNCENKNCPKISKTYQWAKLREKEYSRNQSDYIRLCVSCHRLYDHNKINLL